MSRRNRPVGERHTRKCDFPFGAKFPLVRKWVKGVNVKRRVRPTMTNLYAFWRIDTFPYLTGAHVVHLRPSDGTVLVENAPTRPDFFVPFIVIKTVPGKKLLADLERLVVNERRARVFYDRLWLNELEWTIPFKGVVSKGKIIPEGYKIARPTKRNDTDPLQETQQC